MDNINNTNPTPEESVAQTAAAVEELAAEVVAEEAAVAATSEAVEAEAAETVEAVEAQAEEAAEESVEEDEDEIHFIVIDDELDNVDVDVEEVEAVPEVKAPAGAIVPAVGKNGKRKKKKSPADVIFVICNTLILTMATIVTLYPILNTLAISFNDGIDALRGGIYLWPRVFTLKNYNTVLSMEDLIVGAQNSVLRTIIGTILQVGTTALLAYVLSVKDFLFGKQVSFFYVLTMYLGAGLIPTFLWFRSLHLTNTFWVYVIPGMVSAFNLLVLRTSMKEIPESLRESAQLDGAGHLTVFFRIYLPLSKPVLATVALFVAVGQWSSWFDNMIYNRTNDDLTTLQYELMKLLSSVSAQTSGGSAYTNNTTQAAQVTPTSVRAAATMVTSMPIVVLYPFLQRYFVTGMTIGGVKE